MTIDLNRIKGVIEAISAFVVAVLLIGSLFKATGHPLPYVPALDPLQLCYLCGASYLARK